MSVAITTEDKVRVAKLASILRGEMIRKIVQNLQDQSNNLGTNPALEYDQTIKLSGSVVPFLLSPESKITKIPNDLDLAVQTDSGNRPSSGWRRVEEKIKHLLKGAARNYKYDFTPISSSSGSEHCGIITARFTKEQIKELLIKKGLEATLATAIPQSGLDVRLPIHFVHNPLNILPALLYDAKWQQKHGQLRPFLRDDLLDILSLKLARVIVGDDDKTMHVSDMLDIARIMEAPELRAEAIRDIDLLRVLIVTRLAEKISIARDKKDDLNQSREALATNYNIRFAFSPETDESAFARVLDKKGYLSPGEAENKKTLATVDKLLEELFPERQSSIGAPLTEGEKEFIMNVIAPDPHECSHNAIKPELLVKGKARNVFSVYPDLSRMIWDANALHQVVDEHGAMRTYD